MDNKRQMFTIMLAAVVLILGWQIGFDYLYKKMGWKPAQEIAKNEAPTTAPAGGAGATTQGFASTNPTTGESFASTAPSTGLQVRGANPGTTSVDLDTTIGSSAVNDPNYPLQLSLKARGAGIDSVLLNQFWQIVEKKHLYEFQQPYPTLPDLTRPLATRNLVINGTQVDLFNVEWKLESRSENSATYSVDIVGPSGPLVRVRKTYELQTRPATKGQSEGYEVTLRQSFENLSRGPLTITTLFNGANPPPAEVARGMDRMIVVGYLGNNSDVTVAHHVVEEFVKDKVVQDIRLEPKTQNPAIWAGASSVYFDAIIRPLALGNKEGSAPEYLDKIEAEATNKTPGTEEHDVTMTFQTARLILTPAQNLELTAKVFFGPRQRALLKNPYYASPMIAYDKSLVVASGLCGFCTIGWLIDWLVKVLAFFHMIFKDWGIAIILLVCGVRALLHPIMKRSQANMMKMGKMGPEMERLKKKYGDDKDALAKAQMEMYKEMGFTPVLGCAPMFLQMPIFIALWQSLQTTFELRHAPFLWGFTWIKDLSQPDKLISFAPMHVNLVLFSFTIDAFNLLPILVAIVQFISFKYTPRPPAATPEAEQQQKMMQWMTLIFPLFFYKMPSGLNIYYLTSTTIGIIEGKIIRKHIKEREEAEKLNGPVIVDAPSSRNRGKGNGGSQSRRDDPPKRTGGLSGILQKLQDYAEQAKRDADRRGKDKA